MSGLNKVCVIGNLGKDPEIRNLNNGGKIVSFSVAVSETWKDKNTGERQEKTEWIPVTIFNEHIAGVAEKYLSKGSKVYIEGQFQTRKWKDKDGNDRYTTEVVLQKFRGELILLGDRGGSGGGGDDGGSDRRGDDKPKSNRSPKIDPDLDDQIPF